jgi:hypothetical protein
MKKAVMTGLAALRGTFAVCGQYLKRWFPVREICVVHSVIVLTIPALFIGCGAPVGALFDDTLKTKTSLPPEVVEIPVEDTQDTILKQKNYISVYYPNPADPYNQHNRQDVGVDISFYELNEMLFQYPSYTFCLTDGRSVFFEGDLAGMGHYLLANWKNFIRINTTHNGGQKYKLEIFPPPRSLIITGTNFDGAVSVSLSDTAGGGTTVAVGAGVLTGVVTHGVPGSATIPLQNNGPNNYLANWTGDDGEYFINLWREPTSTGDPPSYVTRQKIRFFSTETTTVVDWREFQ